MKPAHAANDNLIGRTRQFWRARTRRDLTDEDARQIAENATGLFSILAEWSRAEIATPAKAKDDARPCRGGAVRLAEPGDVLMIGEGVETCLAAMQASGHPAWAALSTSGLRSLNLPTMSAT